MSQRETDALTAEAVSTWNASAPGWDANADLIAQGSEPVTAWLIEHLDPQPGQTILELGAGPGDTGFEAARRIGDTGRLVSTDISPDMTEVARQRAQAAGLTNVEFRVMDAQHIDMKDDSVDGVIHRYGPMLLPDPASSMTEVRRVLRRDGRYVAAVWSGSEHNPWVLTIGISLLANNIDPPGDAFAPGGIFSLSEPAALRAALEKAGFKNIEIQPVDQPLNFDSFEDLWLLPTQIAGPISLILRNLSEPQLAAYRSTFRELVEPHRTPTGYTLPAQALCAQAR
jgi:ubiquinone/menaquinone biosynthesis C-methylase UbiE